MTEPNTLGGLIGGALIGLAAVLLLATQRPYRRHLRDFGRAYHLDRLGRPFLALCVFIFGLLAGAGLYAFTCGGLPLELHARGPTLLAAGLLVGVGTRLGSGCTSGHGVWRSSAPFAAFAAGNYDFYGRRSASPSS